MKRKHPPPPPSPPRPIPSSKRKEGKGERNGLIKRKEGEDYEEDWETRGEREDKSAIGELPFFFFLGQAVNQINLRGRLCLSLQNFFFFFKCPLHVKPMYINCALNSEVIITSMSNMWR